MTADLAAVNRDLERDVPALFAALSPLGKRVFFPADIPAQAADARGKAFNATIGQITDGRGGALVLPAFRTALAGFPEADLHAALLYSPVEGRPELRERWRGWQRRDAPGDRPSTLPIVTVGLTHALSLVADLFGGEGRPVVIPAPFWGNYRQTFATRTGARILPAPFYRAGAFDPEAIESALAGLPDDEPAVAFLNLPSNPTGYMPTVDEREALRESLLRAADHRPLVVLCDDAYAGLVHEPGIPTRSMFWELAGVHDRLVAVKVDGATKEVSLFGGRVGFLTFAAEPDSAVARALESKVKCLSRATLGSPVATSQLLLLQALRASDLETQVAVVRSELARRFHLLHQALAGADPELVRPLPCNAGCFAVVELPTGLDPDRVRHHLLDTEDTGLVSIAPRYLRIAYCSVAAEDLPELVRRMERGIAACLG